MLHALWQHSRMATTRPVVLVHGAWHGAWCWALLQAELDSRGIASYAIDLPGHGASITPLADLNGDVAHLREVMDIIGPDAVLVGHSYGGAVVSGAADPATINSVVYLAAFALQADESINEVVRACPTSAPPLRQAIIMGVDGTSALDPAHAPAALYGCCPPSAIEAALARIGRHPMISFEQPVAQSPLGKLPTVYVRCTLDGAIPLAQQDVMAARCDRVVTLETDHSPFISSVTEVADLLEQLALVPAP
jgi:pimeloyl-ACP methyl ester carboxylesterase